MALLKNISIKSKLLVALIATGLVLVVGYVLLAKNVFEKDKISYVFDSQSIRLESLRAEVDFKIQRSLNLARAIIASYQYDQVTNQIADQLLASENALLGVELWDETSQKNLVSISKDGVTLPSVAQQVLPENKLVIAEQTPQTVVFAFRYPSGQSQLRLMLFVTKSDLFSSHGLDSFVAFWSKGQAFLRDPRSLPSSFYEELFQKTQATSGPGLFTELFSFAEQRYLISRTSSGLTDLSLVLITPELEALGALSLLFNRSLVFIVFSFFGLLLVSLTLARGLTRDLQVLTASAEEIGRGNFLHEINIESGDEMGVLAQAFQKMSGEIERLLAETKEKVRMEQELKTARFVQEKLLPSAPSIQIGNIEISGRIINSSECGGDWWTYFEQDNFIFVAIADATGHGTPAALMTAAARAVFSRLQNEQLSLAQMLTAWDQAIQSCGQGELYMTGLILRINKATGECVIANAAHDAPYYFSRAQGETHFESAMLDLPLSPRVGQGGDRATTPEVTLQLQTEESLMLYTDGIFSVTLPDGKTLSDRRLGKKLAKQITQNSKADEILAQALGEFDSFRGEIPVPDDVSVIVIRRVATN